MDIFTTQLTRVVPVPIKPASLKVKALLKEAGTSKLKEDPDHLENHDYYFVEKQDDNEVDEENKQETKPAEQQAENSDEKSADVDSTSKSKEEVKHLDLYV
ncbi:MAG: hypothetical protein QNK36_11340 [Colwellia sp.]|nr:hypothetical protein [Colwellia sp.]